MGKIKFAPNQSLYQTAYVGQLQPDGQFKILWQSKQPLLPEPYDPLSFPGKKFVLN
jgi:urea transport system substrate-binding protein